MKQSYTIIISSLLLFTLIQSISIENYDDLETTSNVQSFETKTRIQAGMITYQDVNPVIPEDEIIVNTGVASIAITRYGFRLVQWYDNTSETELAANSGVSSSGGDLIANRHPLWSWVTSQPWTGELWDAPFNITTSENSGIATVSGSYTFNDTYGGTASPLGGLKVNITFKIADGKHWGNLTINFHNPTNNSISLDGQDTGNRMGYSLGYGGMVGPNLGSDYQAYSHGGQVSIGQLLSWNFFQWNDLEWSGIYDLSEGAFGGMIYHNATKYLRLETSSWGIETRVCYSETTISSGESISYSLSLYGGPLTAEMEEAGITGFLDKLGIIGTMSSDKYVHTTLDQPNVTIFLENVNNVSKDVTVKLFLETSQIWQWTSETVPGDGNITLTHKFTHGQEMGVYNIKVEVEEASELVFEKTINLNIVDTTLTSKKLYLSFVWHQHQPFYTEPFTDPPNFLEPWAQAHTEGPYLWQIQALADHPEISATINLQPSLLEQWKASRNGWLNNGVWTLDWVDNINQTIDLHYDVLHNTTRNGKLQLLTSGYNHPIFALLENWGWDDDINRQIVLGKNVTANLFDYTPYGAWQPEMSFNTQIVPYWVDNGINHTIWSDANLGGGNLPFEPYLVLDEVTGKQMVAFFRYTPISNDIGFRYNGYASADDAARDFMGQIVSMYKNHVVSNDLDKVLTVALDGENYMIWGSPASRYFTDRVYAALEESQSIGWVQTATLEEAMHYVPPTKTLVTEDFSYPKDYPLPDGGGSWVDGSTSTWYGEPDENLLWKYIMEGREFLKNFESELSFEEQETFWRYITIAEGSDAFWWAGTDQQIGDDWQFTNRMIMYIDAITSSINHSLVTLSEPRNSWQAFVEGNSQDTSILSLKNIDLVNNRTIELGSISKISSKNVTLSVESRGKMTAKSVQLELILPIDLELVQGVSTHNLGDLPSLSVDYVTWEIGAKSSAQSTSYTAVIRIIVDGILHKQQLISVTVELPSIQAGLLQYPNDLLPEATTQFEIQLTNIASVPATNVNVSLLPQQGIDVLNPLINLGSLSPFTPLNAVFDVNITGYLSTDNLTFRVDAQELETPVYIYRSFTTAEPFSPPVLLTTSISGIYVEDFIVVPISFNNLEGLEIYGLVTVEGDRIRRFSDNFLLVPGVNVFYLSLQGLSGGQTTLTITFKFGNTALTVEEIETSIIDLLSPDIEILNVPSEMDKDARITVSANATDHSGISFVQLFISTDGGSSYTMKSMALTASETYAAIIGPFSVAKVFLYVKGVDSFGNEGLSSVITIDITGLPLASTTTTTVTSTTMSTTTSQDSPFPIWISLATFALVFPYWQRKRRD
ncbi:MAG: hypothetical protein ACW98F_10130 [Candidatus Hodarchaeales archaeon]|jgi:alpha-amylase/alpha-mannosidase (GH57 family)